MSEAELSGWANLSLWRKAIYGLVALVLGAVFGGPILAILSAVYLPLALLGLGAVGFFTWRVYLYIRADIDYVDSEQYSRLNPWATPPRHWP